MAKRQSGGKRQSVRKFMTPVQGPRAYVTFQKPTWGEIRVTVESVRAKTKDYISATVAVATGEKRPVGDKATEVEETLTEALWDLASEKFEKWNWVDDEGGPLADLPEMSVDDLYGDEVQDIFKAVQSLYMMSNDEDGDESQGN